MSLYRLRLRPTSPWRTPWHADTLAGMLLATCARVHGADVLRDLIVDPMLEGRPAFVLSDACPGDLLPAPLWLRLADWGGEADHKRLKRARWLPRNAFLRACRGQLPELESFVDAADIFVVGTRQHNTLDRFTDTTGAAEAGLGIFDRPEVTLAPLNGAGYLSVYFRILEPGAEDLLLEFFHELALVGFGADVSTGRGQFEILGEPESVPYVDQPPENANAVITLSTFQPGPTDPTEGLWEAFPKFGKLGPDFGLPNTDVRKNTLLLFRPGACFHTPDTAPPFLGRAVPMEQLLPKGVAERLAHADIKIIHPAFALAMPARIEPEYFA